MNSRRLEQLIDFLKETEKLKLVQRRVKISSCKRFESTAEHAWDIALWAWLFSKDLPRKLNLLRTLKLLLMHDLVEIYAGDTFLFDHVSRQTKRKKEDEAAKKLFAKLPNDLKKELKELWLEFEAGKTREAKTAHSMDKLQPILQNILSDGYGWKLHKITAADIRKHKLNYMTHDKNILKIYQKLVREAREAKLI